MDILKNIDIQLLAKNLYKQAWDFDFLDYKGETEKEINDIENALYYLKTVCENEYNHDYFRTFYKCLALAFNSI